MILTDELLEQIAAGAAAELSEVACPYIGLKPFSEKWRLLFLRPGGGCQKAGLIDMVYSGDAA